VSITTHERFTSYPCNFDSLTVNHVRNVALSPACTDYLITPGGAVDPQLCAAAFFDPAFSITSGDLATILAAVSPTAGLALSTLTQIQLQQRADGGTFLGAGNHFVGTGYKGFLAVDEISGAQDDKNGASIKLKWWGLYDGTHAPLTLQSAQNLTGTVAYNALFRMSEVVFEGSKLLGVESVSVKPGLKVSTKRSSGGIYPDVSSIIGRDSTIEIHGTNLAVGSAVGPGVDAISSGLTVYFALINGSGSVNVSFTAPSGGYKLQNIGASGTSDAKAGIIAKIAGGTLAFSTTAALP
jgi:hypothetical protein